MAVGSLAEDNPVAEDKRVVLEVDSRVDLEVDSRAGLDTVEACQTCWILRTITANCSSRYTQRLGLSLQIPMTPKSVQSIDFIPQFTVSNS